MMIDIGVLAITEQR